MRGRGEPEQATGGCGQQPSAACACAAHGSGCPCRGDACRAHPHDGCTADGGIVRRSTSHLQALHTHPWRSGDGSSVSARGAAPAWSSGHCPSFWRVVTPADRAWHGDLANQIRAGEEHVADVRIRSAHWPWPRRWFAARPGNQSAGGLLRSPRAAEALVIMAAALPLGRRPALLRRRDRADGPGTAGPARGAGRLDRPRAGVRAACGRRGRRHHPADLPDPEDVPRRTTAGIAREVCHPRYGRHLRGRPRRQAVCVSRRAGSHRLRLPPAICPGSAGRAVQEKRRIVF